MDPVIPFTAFKILISYFGRGCILSKCKEEDFYQIKSVALGRLRVSDLYAFFWAVFVFCAAMTVVALFGISAGELEITTFLALMIPISLIFLLVNFVNLGLTHL